MSHNRNPWTQEEDSLLIELVSQLGNSKWEQVARSIGQNLQLQLRTGKQCRERWHNHLNPEINRNAWTESEKKIIFDLHGSLGNRWSLIAKHLDRRTDNSVKNFFYSTLRREERKKKRGCKREESADYERDAIDILFQLSRDCLKSSEARLTKNETGESRRNMGELTVNVIGIII